MKNSWNLVTGRLSLDTGDCWFGSWHSIFYLFYIQSQYIKNYLKNHKQHFVELHVVAWHDKSAACCVRRSGDPTFFKIINIRHIKNQGALH